MICILVGANARVVKQIGTACDVRHAVFRIVASVALETGVVRLAAGRVGKVFVATR